MNFSWFNRLMRTLRLYDERNQLSITNIFCFVLVVKVALLPVIDFAACATLLIAISAYTGKRLLAAREAKTAEQLQAGIDTLRQAVESRIGNVENHVNALNLQQGFAKLDGGAPWKG